MNQKYGLALLDGANVDRPELPPMLLLKNGDGWEALDGEDVPVEAALFKTAAQAERAFAEETTDDDEECWIVEFNRKWKPSLLKRIKSRKFSATIDLTDQADRSAPPLPVKLRMSSGILMISPQGYGECNAPDGEGDPICIEVYEGRLRVLVWSDINQEDCTHIIDMEKARESNRVEQ